MTEKLPFGNQPEIPVGEGLVGGFIAPIHSAVLWMVRCYDELDAPMVRSTPSGFHWYYWPEDQFEAADKARESVDQFGPALVWRLEVAKDDVIGASNLDMFGDSIGGDVAVKTLQSAKYRHELHLLALPAAVAATAKLLGFDVPAFDIGDVTDRYGDYGDERSAYLIGNPNMRKMIDEPSQWDEVHYTQSTFWLQRIEIWKALGEDNPLAYLAEPKEDMKPKMVEKYVTTSDKLAQCLRVFSTWKSPLWGRLTLVADPRVDATYGDDKRLSLPLIMALYADEDAARAAAEADGMDLSGGLPTDAPPLPPAWDDEQLRHEWPIMMKTKIKPAFAGPKTVRERKLRLAKDDLLSDYGVTPDDVIAWWDAV